MLAETFDTRYQSRNAAIALGTPNRYTAAIHHGPSSSCPAIGSILSSWWLSARWVIASALRPAAHGSGPRVRRAAVPRGGPRAAAFFEHRDHVMAERELPVQIRHRRDLCAAGRRARG